MKQRIKLLNNCVAKEAMAAPRPPQRGISRKFATIFKIAPDKLITGKYFCLSFASIHMFRTVPILPKDIYHTATRKISDVGIKEFPNKRNTICLEKIVIIIPWAKEIRMIIEDNNLNLS